MATPYAPKDFIVAEFLPEGLTLLCGPSKIGKSWFVLQLCLCVSLGVRFMGFNTTKCDVLYLALEDTFQRVKDRIARLTDETPTNLRFAVQAGTLGGTLEEQLTLLGADNVKPNVLTRNLSTKAYDYLKEVGILYASGRTGSGRWIELTLKPSDGNDAKDASEEIPSQPSLCVTS